jgi:hypothetical protein
MKTTWMKKAAVAAMMILVLSGTALAFQAATTTPVAAAAAAGSIWTGLLKGILAAAVAAGMGWAAQQKSTDGAHEAFDLVQFIATVVLGAAIGAYAGWKNMSMLDVENLPILSSIIAGIEMVIKVVWRNGAVHVAGALATLKAGTEANPTPPAPPKP